MADEHRPLLVFPVAGAGSRDKLVPGFGKVKTPGRARQGERLGPEFLRLQEVMGRERARLTANVADVEPEKVVVFETVGPIQNFINAIRTIDGLEWLVDAEMEIAPDDDFHAIEKPEKVIKGHLYLLMSDSKALASIVSMWNRFQRSRDSFAIGLAPWRDAFEHLHAVRYWNRDDRLRETGFFEHIGEVMLVDDEAFEFEIDLWHRQTQTARAQASQRLRAVISGLGGAVLAEAVQPEIGYHAMLVALPAGRVRGWVEAPDSALFDLDEVMFFRPIGQAVARAPDVESEPLLRSMPPCRGDPVVALFDGLPVERHGLLANGLRVDDPDGLAADYPVSSRHHGTSMASLILRGDLNAREAPLERPIYVRPVLMWRGRDEGTPRGTLVVDLMVRAVRRLFESMGDEGPAAPSVRLINHSLGDRLRLFDGRLVSPWARVLDWLAWRYRVLFLVSAGNHADDRALDDFDDEVFPSRASRPERVEAAFLRDAHRGRAVRRLRVPAESMNALTVGALHADHSDRAALGRNFEPFDGGRYPSPINGLGFGYRGGIKPEVLFPGGRVVYADRMAHRRPPARVALFEPRSGPGMRVAAPSARGRLDETTHTCGTSNATALATRAAAQLYEMLQALRAGEGGDRLDDRHTAVLLKALLVHGAAWGDVEARLDAVLSAEAGLAHGTPRKRAKARLLGYGGVDVTRVMACTARRATVLGCGEVEADEGHEYRLPIPAALSGRRGLKRVVVTLGWLTPINSAHQAYRRARLWVSLPSESHGKRLWHLSGRGPDPRDAARGTVQHCVYESERAVPIVDEQELVIRVNCRAEAGALDEAVPYGLAVTLEVAESMRVDVYSAVRQRLRARSMVRPPR